MTEPPRVWRDDGGVRLWLSADDLPGARHLLERLIDVNQWDVLWRRVFPDAYRGRAESMA